MRGIDRPDVTDAASRGRSIAFRIVAGVLGVFAIAFSVPFAVASFVDDSQEIHRFHNLAFTGLYGVLLGVALLASARRPSANVSAFFVAVGSGMAGSIAGLASRDFVSGVWYSAPISIVVLWALHPSRERLLRPSGFDLPTVALALLALVPAIAFALTQSELQRTGFASDPHRELHHFSGMAAAALALPVCAFAASLRETGRRLGAWLVAVAAAVLGAGSLVLADDAGAFDPLWAWLTLAWGAAIVVAAERERRPGPVEVA